jgi:NADH-quinone oxidoreductase subunit G
MPALNQQEGTFTNIDKKVVPLNVALIYNGYVLNDIANALGINAKYTINYTKELPLSAGFKAIEFDDLSNSLDKFGKDVRGYDLDIKEVAKDESLDEVEELDAYDGPIVYNCNLNEHLGAFTNSSTVLKKDLSLVGSKQFADAAKISHNQQISFKINDISFEGVFRLDESMKGTIAINPVYDLGLELPNLKGYRFNRLQIITKS